MQRFIMTLIGVAIAGTVVCAQAGDPDKGKAAFTEHKCGTCHKTTAADEKGGKMSTVLGDTVGKLSPGELKAWLTDTAAMEAKLPAKPKVLMSAYLKNQKLTDADVANLVAYLKTLPAK
jgi:cytochrome c2